MLCAARGIERNQAATDPRIGHEVDDPAKSNYFRLLLKSVSHVSVYGFLQYVSTNSQFRDFTRGAHIFPASSWNRSVPARTSSSAMSN